MDRQKLLPVGEGEVDQRLHDLDAGVADQDVDLAVLRHGVGDALLDLGLVGDVHGDREGVAALGALISSAVASAASRLRSAITGIAPSAAKRSAISLPMPLAAPVTMATLPSKRDMR